MVDPQPDHDGPPPLGSWARTYALVCVCAIAVVLLLYWFTQTYQLRLRAA